MIDARIQVLLKELKAAGVRVKYDYSDNSRPGWKFAEYEMKGVPLRIAVGARDLENNTVELARRDTREKQSVSMDGLSARIPQLLEEVQQAIFDKAKVYRDQHITKADTWADFEKLLNEKGGFIAAHWDGTAETEARIKELTKATIRCIPLQGEKEPGRCVISGQPSTQRAVFAKAY